MKIEVKKIKTFMGMDCPGYNCDLHVDGKLVAYVVDDGSGGSTGFCWVENGKEVWNGKMQKAVEAYCTAMPPVPVPDSKPLSMTLELYVALEVEKMGVAKKLQQTLKKATCFKTPKNDEGEYQILKLPFTPSVKDVVLKKYPEAIFLNEVFPDGNWYDLIHRPKI